MQHNDDHTRGRVVRLDRTQRSARPQGNPAGRHADEVSGCKRSPEREAHRPSFNPDIEVTAESLIGLLPDAKVTNRSIDDVCRQTLFLANLVSSPYVRVA